MNFTQKPLNLGEYENCTFRNCNFEYLNISGFRFTDCEFIESNLSMTKLIGTAFREVVFKDCKMYGMAFNDCNEFGMSFKFEGCALNNSVFYKSTIRKTQFKNSKLIEVDFSEADISNSVISNCDLSGAIFDRTNLEKADLRTSFNYTINPAQNNLRKTKFSLSEVHGLLRHLDIEVDKNS
ncbi:pentapeptide repeat-containing protein [Flavobacteriaceae bacterium W22]|nr:pentapeptide repeat-containing protein [Flavobacteriaceae bacterium W22]